MSVKKTRIMMSLPYALLGFIAVCLLLTGCLQEPTKLSQNKVQVQQEKFTDNVAVASLNEAAIKGLAEHYRKHGDGPVDLTVTYDPKVKTAGAMYQQKRAVMHVQVKALFGKKLTHTVPFTMIFLQKKT